MGFVSRISVRMVRNWYPTLREWRPVVLEKLSFGSHETGFWNCGLLVWRPKAVSPVMVCVLIPPVMLGVVGRPWKPPNMADMLGPPRNGGTLPARIWDQPRRAWKREVGVTVQV